MHLTLSANRVCTMFRCVSTTCASLRASSPVGDIVKSRPARGTREETLSPSRLRRSLSRSRAARNLPIEEKLIISFLFVKIVILFLTFCLIFQKKGKKGKRLVAREIDFDEESEVVSEDQPSTAPCPSKAMSLSRSVAQNYFVYLNGFCSFLINYPDKSQHNFCPGLPTVNT